jgi:hypothetical protein
MTLSCCCSAPVNTEITTDHWCSRCRTMCDLQPPAQSHSELCTGTCCNKSGPSEPASKSFAANSDSAGGSVQTSEIEKLLERFKDRAKAYLVYKEQLDFEEVETDATDLASDGLKILAYVRSLESKLSIAVEALKYYDDPNPEIVLDSHIAAEALSKILPPT